MGTSTGNKNNPVNGFRFSFWDILTGIPAGLLIFMGTVLLSTLIGSAGWLAFPIAIPPIILGIVSILVGILAGITRLSHGPATALAAAITTAILLGFLWLAARPGDQYNPFVIGPIGMIITFIFSPLGGLMGARLRKAL